MTEALFLVAALFAARACYNLGVTHGFRQCRDLLVPQAFAEPATKSATNREAHGL